MIRRGACSLLWLFPVLAAAATPTPKSLAALELDDGDESLSRVSVNGGAVKPVQTENEETAKGYGFLPSGTILYTEGARLRMESETDETPILASDVGTESAHPLAVSSTGRVAYATTVEVQLGKMDEPGKKLEAMKPVVMPPHCVAQELAFTQDDLTLLVLCRTPPPVATWLVRVDVATARGDHVYAKDVDRLLGPTGLADKLSAQLVRRSEGIESIVSFDVKGKPKIVHTGNAGEHFVDALPAHGELLLVATKEGSSQSTFRAVKVGKPGAGRALGRSSAVQGARVWSGGGWVTFSAPSAGETEGGDVDVMQLSSGKIRTVLRAEPSKKHLFRVPLLGG